MNQNEQMREALRKAYALGQKYWQQADSDYESEQKKSDATYEMYKQLVEDTVQALAAKPAPLVRLTEEEVLNLYLLHSSYYGFQKKFANAVQDALIAKNGGKV